MARRIYDYPERSLLGRVITHAFLINLDQVDSEEEVKQAMMRRLFFG